MYKTEEERENARKEKHRLRQKAYRARNGDNTVGIGRVKKDERVFTERIGQAIVHTKEKRDTQLWRPEPETKLTKDSKLDDLLPWCMEVAEELRANPMPGAWASALNAVLKIIEILDKKLPPVLPVVKPRPRMVIVIDDEKYEEE